MMNFSKHSKVIVAKLQKRNNVLKALADSAWGKSKETILTTFKAIGKSIINYAAPIWTPQASKTSLDKIQVCQNAALRVVYRISPHGTPRPPAHDEQDFVR